MPNVKMGQERPGMPVPKMGQERPCIDCTACAWGYNGDSSCSAGGDIKKAGKSGCQGGKLIAQPRTPAQKYKQMQMEGLGYGSYQRSR